MWPVLLARVIASHWFSAYNSRAMIRLSYTGIGIIVDPTLKHADNVATLSMIRAGTHKIVTENRKSILIIIYFIFINVIF